jgi:hypothetical protein
MSDVNNLLLSAEIFFRALIARCARLRRRDHVAVNERDAAAMDQTVFGEFASASREERDRKQYEKRIAGPTLNCGRAE